MCVQLAHYCIQILNNNCHWRVVGRFPSLGSWMVLWHGSFVHSPCVSCGWALVWLLPAQASAWHMPASIPQWTRGTFPRCPAHAGPSCTPDVFWAVIYLYLLVCKDTPRQQLVGIHTNERPLYIRISIYPYVSAMRNALYRRKCMDVRTYIQ